MIKFIKLYFQYRKWRKKLKNIIKTCKKVLKTNELLMKELPLDEFTAICEENKILSIIANDEVSQIPVLVNAISKTQGYIELEIFNSNRDTEYLFNNEIALEYRLLANRTIMEAVKKESYELLKLKFRK